jgi:2-polyprenyl-3-methyl-5-hydroxy-6-metoxy-1,4-benzoquinol methylase
MDAINNFIKVPLDYKLTYTDGIYTITTDSFNDRLSEFLLKFSEIQLKEKHYQLPFELYENFPNVNISELASETFTRKQDLVIISDLLSKNLNNSKSVLEVSGWNNWLSNYLSKKGLMVFTVDIFDDDRNGLKSKKHYQCPIWNSIQTDVLQIEIYNSKFDLIVFNHCLQFLTDPIQLIEKYKKLLNKNGVLVIIGSTFYKNTNSKVSEVFKTKIYFEEKYNFGIQFYESKGYFSYQDFKQFSKNSFNFISYKFSIPGLLKKFLKKEKSGILYFINS